MSTPTDSLGPWHTLVGRIPIYPGQELHLRQRGVHHSHIPDCLELALYNTETDNYYLSTTFPQTPETVDQMIALLTQFRTTM